MNGHHARILFMVRVPAERTEEFLGAYEKIRHEVASVPGHLVDQVCRSSADPEQWLITSEWSSLESFAAWERSTDHRALARPMRECMTEAKSTRFVVHAQTASTRTGAPRRMSWLGHGLASLGAATLGVAIVDGTVHQ